MTWFRWFRRDDPPIVVQVPEPWTSPLAVMMEAQAKVREAEVAIARSLTTDQQNALCGRWTFASQSLQEEGRLRLIELGLWHAPLIEGTVRCLRTELGQRVRRLIEESAL